MTVPGYGVSVIARHKRDSVISIISPCYTYCTLFDHATGMHACRCIHKTKITSMRIIFPTFSLDVFRVTFWLCWVEINRNFNFNVFLTHSREPSHSRNQSPWEPLVVMDRCRFTLCNGVVMTQYIHTCISCQKLSFS